MMLKTWSLVELSRLVFQRSVSIKFNFDNGGNK